VDAFLQHATESGRQDSAGIFTLDVRKAKLKLSEYQLLDFSAEFPKMLVSVAHAAGLESLVIREDEQYGRPYTRVLFQGLTLTTDDIQTIGFLALKSDTPRHLRYLSYAISALTSQGPVFVASYSDKLEFCLKIGRESLQEQRPPEEMTASNATVLLVDKVFEDIFEYQFRALHKWTPVRLRWTGLRLPAGILAEDIYQGATTTYQHAAEKGSTLGHHFLAYFATESENPTGLLSLVDGLPYKLKISSEFPFIGGFIVADNLKRDLSFQNLVEDDAYHQMEQQLKRSIVRLLEEVIRTRDSLDDWEAGRFVAALCALEEEFDVSAPFQTLNASLGKFEPVTEDVSIQPLLARLKAAPLAEASQLFLDYEKRVRIHWAKGQLDSTLVYLKAENAIRDGLREAQPARLQLLRLLERYQKGTANYQGLCESMRCYLEGLDDWESGQAAPDFDDQIHPSWQVPVLLVDGDGSRELPEECPEWLALLACLETEDFKTARTFLRNSQLAFEIYEGCWYQVLYLKYRSSLPWHDVIKLRARLSVVCASQLDIGGLLGSLGLGDFTSLSGGVEQAFDRIVKMVHGETDFWPGFFLLYSQIQTSCEPLDSRRLWGRFLRRCLLQKLFEEPETNPLSSRIQDSL
jgi:hypothetical protein